MMNIASRCKTLFYRLVAVGLGVTYGVQVFLTVGGAIKFIPMTGVTLPFVSYGLTSLVSLYIGMGLVLNVGLQSSTYNKEIIQKEIDRREDYL